MAVEITNIEFSNGEFQQYDSKDVSLINSVSLQRKFGLDNDYIELHIYDVNNTLLTSNYNFINYSSPNTSKQDSEGLMSELGLDPTQDLINEGLGYGTLRTVYNIFRNIFDSSPESNFYIKGISSDRKELRIANNSLSNAQLEQAYTTFILSFSSEAYYKDFYLNFGSNNLIIGVNVLLEQDPDQFNLLIKLYEPLPPDVDVKDQFWIVDQLSSPIAFEAKFTIEPVQVSNENLLRGPNFNIEVNNNTNASTEYLNYDQLFSNDSQTSFQQLKSLLDEKSLEINIDYSDYNNFIHFSSAKERLLNFRYKLKLIEEYDADIALLATSNLTPQVSSSRAIIENNKNKIIEKFDGYEYYLYYESSSTAWPKQNSLKPYINYSITSSQAIEWLGSDIDDALNTNYGGQLLSASQYDYGNQNGLVNTIPEYIRIDSENQQYELFLHMIGQHFDNIWLYAKGITDIYDAQNDLYKGISKDLVYHALSSLGIKLYTNKAAGEDLYSYLLGTTPSGSYLPSTGSEWITNYVTASNETFATSDLDKEVFKRIYHNLPYLLKSKGTGRGLRALIACYGVPETILNINEYGGGDKYSGSYDQYYSRLSYALNTREGIVYVKVPWGSSVIENPIVPDTIEFRFKTNGIPTTTWYSQSLFQVNTGSETQMGIQLLYPPTTSTGSYSEYGSVRFVLSGSEGYKFSNPISLPFFDNGWWNIMVQRETGSTVDTNIDNVYTIYAANNLYDGYDGEGIGFLASASLFISGGSRTSYNTSWNSSATDELIGYLGGEDNNDVISLNTTHFSGFFQEYRTWTTPLSLNSFINHTLNPLSIEDDSTLDGTNLNFRLPLGNDLDISPDSIVNSVHPSITFSPSTGSYTLPSIVSYGIILGFGGVSLYGVAVYGSDVYFGDDINSVVYTENIQYISLNSGNIGLFKPTNDKIRIITTETSGDTLSPFVRLEQNPEIPLTIDTNLLEVAISPQDQVNNDIIAQLGYFDIDDYIGDPREASSVKYSSLEELREIYFKKYTNSYNYFDFIRLIKYYNNSLFKMIKDFVPARTNVATGVVIKSHILERSKHPQFEPDAFTILETGSIEIGEYSADEGGMFGGLTSSFTASYPTLTGNYAVINNNNLELYTGELEGTVLTVTTQSLWNNPYLRTSSVNMNDFIHSEYHVLINNVSQSRLSNKFYDIDYSTDPNRAINLGLILSGSPIALAQLQDSYYSLQRHILPRYDGSKLSGLLYNIYSEGDVSYGYDPVINKEVGKVGALTSVNTSIFLPLRQKVTIKYLVNEEGSFTELNLNNNNWFEVQNTFKAGENLTVALFNNQKYSNQKFTDGVKPIFSSGYDYTPVLYYSSSDNSLTFELTKIDGLDYFSYQNGGDGTIFEYPEIIVPEPPPSPPSYDVQIYGANDSGTAYDVYYEINGGGSVYAGAIDAMNDCFRIIAVGGVPSASSFIITLDPAPTDINFASSSVSTNCRTANIPDYPFGTNIGGDTIIRFLITT